MTVIVFVTVSTIAFVIAPATGFAIVFVYYICY